MSTKQLNTLGARLQHARVAAGLRQHELSSRMGITRGMISMVECGRSCLSADHCVAATSILQVTLDWLLKGVGAGPDLPRSSNRSNQRSMSRA